MSVVIRCVLLLSIVSMLFLQGCGGSSKHPNSNVINVSGVVQKGIFTELVVKAVEVDELSGKLKADKEILAKTDGSHYSLDLPTSGTYVIKAKGRFINEVTGLPVMLEVGLESLISVDTALPSITSNVNLMTHIFTQQVFSRIAAGTSLRDAEDEAQQFVTNSFGFDHGVEFDTLNLLGITEETTIDDPNLQLLLFSAATLDHLQPDETMHSWGAMVETLSTEDDNALIQTALAGLGGLGAESTYLAVQNNLGLPALSLFNGAQPVFLCQLSLACGWQVLEGPSISLITGPSLEADGDATLRIQLSGPSTSDVALRIQSADQGANAGEDYLPLSQSLTIPAGETEIETSLYFLLDNIEENNEYVSVSIISDSSSHRVVNGTVSILIGEGVGDSAN